MNPTKEITVLKEALSNIDTKIDHLNNKKIELFINFLKLDSVPEDYLKFETILIVVPDRHISRELRQYKYTISRLNFATNINAEKMHLYDQEEWNRAFRNKTQLQIRNLLKTSFGGIKSVTKE